MLCFIGPERQGQLCGAARKTSTSCSFAERCVRESASERDALLGQCVVPNGWCYGDAGFLLTWCRSRRTLMIPQNGGLLVSRPWASSRPCPTPCGLQSRARDGRRSLKTCLFGSDSVSLRGGAERRVRPGTRRFMQSALLARHKHGGHTTSRASRAGVREPPMVKIGGSNAKASLVARQGTGRRAYSPRADGGSWMTAPRRRPRRVVYSCSTTSSRGRGGIVGARTPGPCCAA